MAALFFVNLIYPRKKRKIVKDFRKIVKLNRKIATWLANTKLKFTENLLHKNKIKNHTFVKDLKNAKMKL